MTVRFQNAGHHACKEHEYLSPSTCFKHSEVKVNELELRQRVPSRVLNTGLETPPVSNPTATNQILQNFMYCMYCMYHTYCMYHMYCMYCMYRMYCMYCMYRMYRMYHMYCMYSMYGSPSISDSLPA